MIYEKYFILCTKLSRYSAFKEKLAELEIDYEEVEILSSLKNLKQFLYARDTYKSFEGIQGSMQIGIPCLVINEEDCILNIDDLDKLIH